MQSAACHATHKVVPSLKLVSLFWCEHVETPVSEHGVVVFLLAITPLDGTQTYVPPLELVLILVEERTV